MSNTNSAHAAYLDQMHQSDRAWWAERSTANLHSRYSGAWDANDRESAAKALREMARRGVDITAHRWPDLRTTPCGWRCPAVKDGGVCACGQ